MLGVAVTFRVGFQLCFVIYSSPNSLAPIRQKAEQLEPLFSLDLARSFKVSPLGSVPICPTSASSVDPTLSEPCTSL